MIGKYTLIILGTLFFVTSSYALNIDECLLQAETYGDGKSKAYINPACLGLFEGLNEKVKKSKNQNESKEITAYKTIIFIEDLLDKSKKLQIYAGENTLMTSAAFIAWDEDNNEFAILDSNSGRILFYSSIIDGNVSPLRVLESELLLEANSFYIDAVKDEVVITNMALSKELVFSRLANKFGRTGHKKLELVRDTFLQNSAQD